MVQKTDNGWTFQNVQEQDKFLEVDDKLEDGAKVVAVPTNVPRTWDIRPDEKHGANRYR
jgi:hypothetical protein